VSGTGIVDPALSALQFNWGDAYEIELVRDIWRARRRDGLGGWITAGDPEELGRQVAGDYALKRVPRGTDGPQ